MRTHIFAFGLVLFFPNCLPAQKTEFAVLAKSRMTLAQGEAKQEVDADSFFQYSRSKKDGSATLAIDSVQFAPKRP